MNLHDEAASLAAHEAATDLAVAGAPGWNQVLQTLLKARPGDSHLHSLALGWLDQTPPGAPGWFRVFDSIARSLPAERR